ncbi:unnamed protein product [Caenorhabditis auriculariae]|uniref:GP-PDE domain-containing protein n=1 Tax=Caenorhabditis auriculariae TaxID=2777116 RepID=A0A8S1HTJ2_9PELO|nr:unnamed protein product [Caenorhabditis auriculariae]
MGRFRLEDSGLQIVGGFLGLVFVLYLIYPPALLLIPTSIAAAAFLTKNRKCDPKDVERFFAGFKVGGHRGAPHSFPENSMRGFIQAKQDGADLIEFDVALTKDGKAVLMHDDDLDRTTDLRGPIRAQTRLQLDSANICANFQRSVSRIELEEVKKERVPDMEDVIKWSVENNMRMLFDVKDSDTELVDQIGTLFEKYNLYDKAIVCSFLPWVVYRIKRGNQKILTGLTWRLKFWSYCDIENSKPRYTGIKQMVFEWIDVLHVFLTQTTTPWYLGADLLLTNNLDISQALVLDQRRRGMHVAVWTVNDMAEMHWMLETLKIPVLTDYPEFTKKVKHLETIKKHDYLPM